MREINDPLLAYKEYPGPILLLAGPGTGKTFQIEERIKFLLFEKKAKPDEIAVITFTNEAARNMRVRLMSGSENNNGLSRDQHPKIISTMHSLGNAIIGANPKMVGLNEKYDVLTDKVIRRLLLEDACTIADYNRKYWRIVDECRRLGSCLENENEKKCKICLKYKALLRRLSLVDYDDQISLACKVLEKNEQILNEWQSRAKFLLVDEYQDINEMQCDFIKLLSNGQEEGLFVVGDDDQSIYSFRGGNPKYITQFATYFGDDIKIARLAMSWRCPEHILLGAKEVIHSFYPGSQKKPKFTFAEKIKWNEKIKIYDVPSDKKEAEIIAAIAKKKRENNRIIIIIPTKNYLGPLKKALAQYGIEYKYKLTFDDKGLSRFGIFNRWSKNPERSEYLRYILHMIIHAQNKLIESLRTDKKELKEKRIEAEEMIAGLWADVDPKNRLFTILNRRSIKLDENPYLLAIKSAVDTLKDTIHKHGGKSTSLAKFLNICGEYLAPGKTPSKFLSELTDWENELVSANKPSPFEPIEIYNIPSSKGLEADIVIVVGATKDIIPNNDDDIEEQSRLFYVAMTRAKKELYLFSARSRPGSVTYKKKSYQLEKSPFIGAISKSHVELHPFYPSRKRNK